jgi:ABC-2 type transport system ATP-binding protein
MTPDDLVIRTEDLSKHYGRNVGCEKICLRVPRGHIFGFLGPNGAGKSTLIKMMVGLSRPTSGGGEVLGRPLGDVAARRRIGFLPENFRYQEWLTPRELLRYHGRLLRMEPSATEAAASRVLADVGLTEHADRKLRDFSKGMQQRFGLACALLGSPELLFLDEPTSALDPIGRADVRRLLLQVRETGATVFLNSHLLGEVEQVCDWVAVIDHGTLLESGTLSDLLEGPCVVDVDLASPLDPGAAARAAAAAGAQVLEGSEAKLRIGLAGDADIPRLVDALVAAGARVCGVARHRRTLENLFLEITAEGADHGSRHE